MPKTVKRFRGRRVHTVYPEKVQGHPTGNVVVVFAAPDGCRREQEVVPGEQYRAQVVVEQVDDTESLSPSKETHRV